MEQMLQKELTELYGKSLGTADKSEVYTALMNIVQRKTENLQKIQGTKKLYYVSAEFLLGKLLSNNLIALGLFDETREVLRRHGFRLEEIEETENEPSLGNGGLGRLAACFLDSIAALGLCGDGVGLFYHNGLFRQKFEKNSQSEVPDKWITEDCSVRRSDVRFSVQLGERTVSPTMYEIDIPGVKGGRNTLHLFDLDTVDDSIIEKGIDFEKTDIERCLTLFLYPDDSDDAGRLLRVYQQYFMVSCSAQFILHELDERGFDVKDLHRHVVVQINDTHPAMIIPELIRLLMERGLSARKAVSEVMQTCAYTNHTILAEALEKWPIKYLEKAAAPIVPIIRMLDRRIRRKFSDPAVRIIDKNRQVHMAHMAIHFGFSVNGVAALHTEILKTSELKAFNEIYPDKFNNKTNGITFRRWLLHCNPELTSFITSLIGSDFLDDPKRLEELLRFKDDREVLARLLEIKRGSKAALRDEMRARQGVELNIDSIFDVQIKRLHEYKRQQMNALYALYKYMDIKAGNIPTRPITMIFGAKAAPAYTIAKDIIHLILCLGEFISADPDVSPHLQIVMAENYNVTYAEKIIPACDISEQISLASKEASGTGNMKLMLNGAVTLGTLDGANVEIRELVGDDNIAVFGKLSDEVIGLYETRGYVSAEFYEDEKIKPLVDFIVSDEIMSIGDPVSLERLHHELISKDWFMTLLDLKEYIEVKEKLLASYEDREHWAKMSLVNIAKAGYFSSDRTIEEYNKDIWKL